MAHFDWYEMLLDGSHSLHTGQQMESGDQ